MEAAQAGGGWAPPAPGGTGGGAAAAAAGDDVAATFPTACVPALQELVRRLHEGQTLMQQSLHWPMSTSGVYWQAAVATAAAAFAATGHKLAPAQLADMAERLLHQTYRVLRYPPCYQGGMTQALAGVQAAAGADVRVCQRRHPACRPPGSHGRRAGSGQAAEDD